MGVRIGGLVVRERRDGSRGAASDIPTGSALQAASPSVAFPVMQPIDPDSVEALTQLWARVQQDEPRAVLAPWFVHTCHGRLSTVDTAELRGNLVVRYQWNAHDAPVYSLFGTQDLERTAVELLAGIRGLGHDPVVRQVSEQQSQILRSVPGLRIDREPERDEYVLDTTRHSALDGHTYKRMRYAIRHLTEQHRGRIEVRMVDAADPDELAMIESVLLAMPNSSQRTGNDNDAWESACLATFFRNPIGAPVRMFVIEIDGSVKGVGVFELAVGHSAVVFHILRTDSRYEGLVDFGVWVLAQAASRQGIAELNLEEDLGLPGLRRKKEHLHPARMITHYTLRPATGSEI